MSKEISSNKLGEPSNTISASKYDNYIINYSGKSAKIKQNSNSASISGFALLVEGKNLILKTLTQPGKIFLHPLKNLMLS